MQPAGSGTLGAMAWRDLFPPRLPRDVRSELEAALAEAGRPGRARVLGFAEAFPDGYAVGLRSELAVQRGGSWSIVPWETIERGSWNAENRSLRWELVDGRRGSVAIDAPGPMPGIFYERVQASILAREEIEIEGTVNGAVLSLRRDPGRPSAEPVWRASRGRGTPGTPEITALLEAELERRKLDYHPR